MAGTIKDKLSKTKKDQRELFIKQAAIIEKLTRHSYRSFKQRIKNQEYEEKEGA